MHLPISSSFVRNNLKTNNAKPLRAIKIRDYSHSFANFGFATV
jgi:hypothetical protein